MLQKVMAVFILRKVIQSTGHCSSSHPVSLEVHLAASCNKYPGPDPPEPVRNLLLASVNPGPCEKAWILHQATHLRG